MHLVDLIVALSFWFLGFLLLFRIPRCSKSKAARRPYPTVSIVIPAKNEEDSLPILLASLRTQDLTGTDTSVVADESDEQTLDVARAQGVRAIVAPPRPAGWLGKPWCCYQGALAAKGDILVFLDADTFLEQGGLRRIVDTCIEKGVVSVQPFHHTEKPYEELSAFFNVVGMAGMGTFTVFGTRIGPVGLFGPCVAVQRELYFEIGGHSAVKNQVVEDLALGERLKSKRHTPSCYGGKGTISFRMYPNGIGDLIDGWSKGFATGAVKTYLPVLAGIVLWIGGGISATSHLLEALSGQNMLPLVAWGGAYLAYCAQIYWMLFRLGSFRAYTALLYPIPLLFFILVFLYSFFLIFVRRSVRWKGATLDLKNRRGEDS